MTLCSVMSPAEWLEVIQFMQVASDDLRHLSADPVRTSDLRKRLLAHAYRCDELRGKIERAQA